MAELRREGVPEFIASVDAIVIGRKIFETVLVFEAWTYAELRFNGFCARGAFNGLLSRASPCSRV